MAITPAVTNQGAEKMPTEKRTMTKRRHYIAKTSDGRYGLTSEGELWRLAGRNSYMAGCVMDRENIEEAADVADEEARVLTEECRAEFGF
jgi:hypothetical protein